ncbi:hypothetical protein UMC2PCS14_00101 (plasmid) [[Clostridium] sordellii]|uniref:DUF6054 family protein n=1 Tax=Paraclostridium sordellii TaxID=1505 RepID=UPI0005411598|nr:DUF6054 family protein [Paeniclostridium sordellii]CEK36586.1 hypothetical protein UMC2PCS14_00101 (plasmid) [[Clostridium] sordellii] [Paeniclostridium sordellii]
MAKKEFQVSLSPLEIQEIIEKNIQEELIFSDNYDLENEKYILIRVYNKYYMRTRNDVGLVIVCENTTGKNLIKITATGSGDGLFSADLGAGENFIKKVQGIISDYII